MAVDPENHLLVTADTSGEMKTWLIEGFCDGTVLDEEAEPLLKPGQLLLEVTSFLVNLLHQLLYRLLTTLSENVEYSSLC